MSMNVWPFQTCAKMEDAKIHLEIIIVDVIKDMPLINMKLRAAILMNVPS